MLKNWNACALWVEMENGAATMGNSMAVTKKIKNRISIWDSNSTSGYILKRIESRDAQRYLNIHAHSNIICNSQEAGAIQVSIHRRMNKQNVH